MLRRFRSSTFENRFAAAEIYKEANNYYRKICEQKKILHKEVQMSKFFNVTNPADFWKTIKEVRHKDRSVPLISKEKWEDYYSSIYNETESQTLEKNEIEEQPPVQKSKEGLDGEISLEEIQMVAGKLKKNKSPGADKIHNEILTSMPYNVAATVQQLFNKCLEKSEVPKKWCEAVVTPVYEKGSELSPNNYRPISLISTLLKLFTTILNIRLLKYVDASSPETKILNDFQNGFRKGRGSYFHPQLNYPAQNSKKKRKTLCLFC